MFEIIHQTGIHHNSEGGKCEENASKLRRYSKPLIHFYKLRQTNFMLRSRILHLKKQVFLPVTTNCLMLAMIKFDKLYDSNRIVMKVTC